MQQSKVCSIIAVTLCKTRASMSLTKVQIDLSDVFVFSQTGMQGYQKDNTKVCLPLVEKQWKAHFMSIFSAKHAKHF